MRTLKPGETFGIQVYGAQSSKKLIKEIFSKTHYNKTIENQNQRENHKSSKRKEACHLQVNPHKAISSFSAEALYARRRIGLYIQNAERGAPGWLNGLGLHLQLRS